METIGAASAATLGYIVGNLPGAYRAYRAYSAMPPITRRRNVAATKIQAAFRGFLARKKLGLRGRGAMGRIVANRRRLHNSIVTQQKDYASQYSKRRMPNYKKKPWKRFVKKVTAVELQNAATKTVVFNDRIVSTSNAGNQQYLSFCLFGINGGSDNTGSQVGYQDMLRVFDNEPEVRQEGTGSPAIFYPSNGKLHFNTGVLDFTLRNLGEVDAEVDIYYGYHIKNTLNTNLFNQSVQSLRQHFDNSTSDPIRSGNTSVNLYQRGTTPFDCSSALSESGFHILKKTKMVVEPNRSVFIQHRDAKNHVLDMNDLSNIGYAKKKLTYEVLIVHKPSVTSVDNAVSTIGVGVTRKYGYSILSSSNQAVSAYEVNFNPGS